MSKKLLTFIFLFVATTLFSLASKVSFAAPTISEYAAPDGISILANISFLSNGEGKYILPSSYKLVTFKQDGTRSDITIPMVNPSDSPIRYTWGITTVDSSDNLWFTDSETFSGTEHTYIRKIAPNGTITNIPQPALTETQPGCKRALIGLTFKPSGELWGYGGDIDSDCYGVVVKLNPSNGTILNQYDITETGPILRTSLAKDGSLLLAGENWADGVHRSLAKIQSDGAYQTFNASVGFNSTFFMEGPDGNMWAVVISKSNQAMKLIKITPTGTATEYDVPVHYYSNLIIGPDGNIWFPGLTGLGTIATDGTYQLYNSTPTVQLALGPNNTIWAITYDTNTGTSKLLKIAPEKIIENPSGNSSVTTTGANIKAPKTGNLPAIVLITTSVIALLLAAGFTHHKSSLKKTTSPK